MCVCVRVPLLSVLGFIPLVPCALYAARLQAFVMLGLCSDVHGRPLRLLVFGRAQASNEEGGEEPLKRPAAASADEPPPKKGKKEKKEGRGGGECEESEGGRAFCWPLSPRLPIIRCVYACGRVCECVFVCVRACVWDGARAFAFQSRSAVKASLLLQRMVVLRINFANAVKCKGAAGRWQRGAEHCVAEGWRGGRGKAQRLVCKQLRNL